MGARTSHNLDGHRVSQARVALPYVNGSPVTQQELADRVGVHRVTLTRIENNGARVSLDVLERLSLALGRSREWLLGEPDTVDGVQQAREMFATAMEKISDGFDDFTEVVGLLTARAGESAEPARETADAS